MSYGNSELSYGILSIEALTPISAPGISIYNGPLLCYNSPSTSDVSGPIYVAHIIIHFNRHYRSRYFSDTQRTISAKAWKSDNSNSCTITFMCTQRPTTCNGIQPDVTTASHNLQDAGRVLATLHPTCQAVTHVLLVRVTSVHSMRACHGREQPTDVRLRPTHEQDYMTHHTRTVYNW